MARMIPPDCPESVSSTGEREVFDLFKNDPETREWIVLHSLGLAQHVDRLYGEIDFLVLAPNHGVFVLEVKAGRVRRENGVWMYTNRFGSTNTSHIGPFRQAMEAMHSVRNAIGAKFGPSHELTRIVYGYGVMFPHIQFDLHDPEFEPWQVYDRDSRRRPVSKFVTQLSESSHSKVEKEGWYDSRASRPSKAALQALSMYLRGDFERVVSPVDLLEQTERRILALTEEQYGSIDGLEDNERCLFEGGAGTGKTFLAIEYARRRCCKGDRVLFLCFNRLLGNWLEAEVDRSCGKGRVTCAPFHRYLDSLIARSSVAGDFRKLQSGQQDDAFFRTTYPLYALMALEEQTHEAFDVLVLDEGQDLIRSEYLDVLDSMLKGGLAGGRWAIFCDFLRQSIYGDMAAEEMREVIHSRAPTHVKYRLTVNCRNTRPIGEETALVSGFEVPPFLPSNVSGPPVEYKFFKSTEEEREALDSVLHALLRDRIRPNSITILSPVTWERSCLNGWRSRHGVAIEKLDGNVSARVSGNAITFSTIQAFKGLENSIVVLTDVERIEDDNSKALLYVGMSRARQRLFVLMSESTKEQYRSAIRQQVMKSGVAR